MPDATVQPDAAPEEVVIPAKPYLWSRAWNELVHRNAVADFVDKWWYERTYFSSSVPSFVMNGGVLLLQATLHPLPSFVAVALASGLGFANEGHTFYLGLRHNDRSWFGQPQTWRRRRDGAMVRGMVYEDRDLIIREKLRRLPPVTRAVKTLKLWLDEFWKNTNRIPAYILGGAGAPTSLILGGLFGVRGLACALISNGLLAMTAAPEFRLALKAARFVLDHRSLTRTKPGRRIILKEIADIFDSQRLDDREHLKQILSEKPQAETAGAEPTVSETPTAVVEITGKAVPRQVLRPVPVEGKRPASPRTPAPRATRERAPVPEVPPAQTAPDHGGLR